MRAVFSVKMYTYSLRYLQLYLTGCPSDIFCHSFLSLIAGNLALSRALGDFVFKRNESKRVEEQIVIGKNKYHFINNEFALIRRLRHNKDWFLVCFLCATYFIVYAIL